jgi:CheY-like chemotaxis protein
MHTTFLPNDSRENFLTTASLPDGDSTRAVTAIRILVVDDEPLIADTIVQILNRNGFIAEAAYGGREAIAAARLSSPELILSDVLMPHIDGVEAAITIQKFLPKARIVLFSGQAATVEILARARQRGYQFELLAKPLHPTQLIKHLRQE